jgi:hypothetical protein
MRGHHKKAPANWTHAVCARCWLGDWGIRARAFLSDTGDIDLCCFCGRDTDAGIYLRRDPSTTPCQGGRALATLLP